MMNGTPLQRAGLYLLIWCVILLGVLTAGIVLRETDGRWFPVVHDFRVEEVTSHDEGIAVSGTMTKARECFFRELVAYVRYDDDAYPHIIPVTFDATSVVSRSAIEQEWGPWVLHINGEYKSAEVSMYTRHSCHALWDTASRLVAFRVRQEDGSITIRN